MFARSLLKNGVKAKPVRYQMVRAVKSLILLLLLVFEVACVKEHSKVFADRAPGGSQNRPGSGMSGLSPQKVVAPTLSVRLVNTVNQAVGMDVLLPAEVQVTRVAWNFGDGSPMGEEMPPVSHTYSRPGTFTIVATVTESSGSTYDLVQLVNVLGVIDGLNCLNMLNIDSAYESSVGESFVARVNVPSCLEPYLSSIDWSFGDGSNVIVGNPGNHVFAAAGSYTIAANIYSPFKSTGAFVTLARTIVVKETVSHPPTCPTAIREVLGPDEVRSVPCGIDGKNDVTLSLKIVESCSVSGNALVWTEVSRDRFVKHEGLCMGQSCRLSNGIVLPDKTSRVLYSSSSPQGSCSDLSQTRTCSNGVVSGSDSFSEVTCRSGCGEFGRDGTTKIGVVVGESASPVNCLYGETGVSDVFEKIVDQKCSEGSILATNERLGKRTKAGVCPIYNWRLTDSWTACSADCGGQQNRLFDCRDDKGSVADSSRCVGAIPVETRVCDGNPTAVARTESSVQQEITGSPTETCAKNEIGVVVQIRNVTTSKLYACIDHVVDLARTEVTTGPWVTDRRCRKYVAHRCSQDSLSNSQAEGRYQWMRKCADKAPAIKKFLTDFADVKVSGKFTISSAGTRHLYPTFMDSATSPEKTWKAAIDPSASCEVPESAYIAAVCLSSCATPEQEILVSTSSRLGSHNMPFIDALLQSAAFVATLPPNSTMSSRTLVNARVQQWVTEMLDTDHDIVEFKMKSGRSLRLTPNHPVLTDQGAMKLAGSFKVGDNLVRLGGELDPIISIDNMKFHGKVYNLFVESSDAQKNIVITNGYLNGTAYFQNEGASDMNRKLLRNNLLKGAVGR